MPVPEWFAWLCLVGVLGGVAYALRLVGGLLVDVARGVRWLVLHLPSPRRRGHWLDSPNLPRFEERTHA